MDASSALQYIVELTMNGMCDGEPNGAVPAERIRRLRGMQSAWKSSACYLVDHFPYLKGILYLWLLWMAPGNLVVLPGRGAAGVTQQRCARPGFLRVPCSRPLHSAAHTPSDPNPAPSKQAQGPPRLALLIHHKPCGNPQRALGPHHILFPLHPSSIPV